MGLFGGPKVIHEKPRLAGVTATAGAALAAGTAILVPSLLPLVEEARGGLSAGLSPLALLVAPPAAGLLLLLAGAGLLRRSRWALRLALGLAAAGAAASGAGLFLGLSPPLPENSAWVWLLGLWFCLLAFFYLRQKRVAETF